MIESCNPQQSWLDLSRNCFIVKMIHLARKLEKQYQVYLVLLHFIYCASQMMHFLQVEGLWHLCRESLLAPFFFPTAFTPFMSHGHILVILAMFQAFSLLLYYYGDLWSVIVVVNIVIIWGQH